MFYQSEDPYGGGYGGGGYGGGGSSGTGQDTGITGGTDPSSPPTFIPTPNGWWEFFAGAWHWLTETPKTMQAP